MKLDYARAIAEAIQGVLKSSCERTMIAGSIRRQKPDVGDIEVLCIPKYIAGADMLDAKIQFLIGMDVLGYRLNKRGSKTYGAKNKLLVHLPSGIGVDVFSTTEECWPVALVVRTGGKVTNQRISMAALRRGMRFHAYGRGFTQIDGPKEWVCENERDVFEAVNLRYLEPHERD